jgi:gluconate 2-dehydrogenase gamma chain
MDNINRREALKRTAMVMGTALSASTIAGIMQGCSAKPELDWTPDLFSEEQANLITYMAETIIPRTGTPGARDVGVPQFIEDMVQDVYREDQREAFMTGMNAFMEVCEDKNGDPFYDLDEEARLAYLKTYNDKMQSAPRGEAPVDLRFFNQVKELTVAGFFTSEAGATQVLQYKAIPVDYYGCISLEEAGGKTWATS